MRVRVERGNDRLAFYRGESGVGLEFIVFNLFISLIVGFFWLDVKVPIIVGFVVFSIIFFF